MRNDSNNCSYCKWSGKPKQKYPLSNLFCRKRNIYISVKGTMFGVIHINESSNDPFNTVIRKCKFEEKKEYD